MRPPWALAEVDFLDACTRCDDCAAACPTGVVRRGGGGYPEISFRHGECTFCRACVDACTAGALGGAPDDAPWAIGAVVSSACLSASGVACRVCGDHCDPGAIRFVLAPRGIATPAIDAASCTGCGACVAPCPVGAIEIR